MFKLRTQNEIPSGAVKTTPGYHMVNRRVVFELGVQPAVLIRSKEDSKGAIICSGNKAGDVRRLVIEHYKEVIDRFKLDLTDAKKLECALFGGCQNEAWRTRKMQQALDDLGVPYQELDIYGQSYRFLVFDPSSSVLDVHSETLDHSQWNPATAQLNIEEGHKIFSKSRPGEVVTHATIFFRMKETFRALEEYILPRHFSETPNKPFKLWCTACSNGAEAYSYTMCIHNYISTHVGGGRFAVFASDINLESVEEAKRGVYELKQEKLEEHRPYFERYGTIRENTVTFSDEIKQFLSFRTFDIKEKPRKQRFQMIVCANVFQYYGEEAKELFLTNFYETIDPPGYIFVGPYNRNVARSLGLTAKQPYNILIREK